MSEGLMSHIVSEDIEVFLMSENGFAPPKPWRSVSARYLRRVVDDIVNNIGASDDVDDLGRMVNGSAVLPLWPFLLGLMEFNCLPGYELHPQVRAVYARFVALVADMLPVADAGYAAWLVGDVAAPAVQSAQYLSRWRNSVAS